jgi:sugar/nucleoside kinase (ribokinase family)
VSAPDFVAIGHVTLDRFGAVTRPGGAALYAAVTAHRLGLSVGLLTSHADDFPLDLVPSQIEVVSVPAHATTIFEYGHAHGPRESRVRAGARPLTADHVPPDWAAAAIVLLAPVIDEVDPLLADRFPDAAVGLAVQGWLRQPGPEGLVVPRAWDPPESLLARGQALFVSNEDVRGQEEAVLDWFERVPVAVMTAGRDGALLFVSGERYEVPVRAILEVDATGAGDVFAATFLIRYHLEGSPWDAAAAATCAAARSVTAMGWAGVPDAATLEDALVVYRRERDDLTPGADRAFP